MFLDLSEMSVLPNSVEPQIRVMIEGTRASGYAGDIAIDDLVITDKPCG